MGQLNFQVEMHYKNMGRTQQKLRNVIFLLVYRTALLWYPASATPTDIVSFLKDDCGS